MHSAGPIRTVVGAVLCGFGVTCGLAVSAAWGYALVLILAGIAVVAIPTRRRAR